jgi:hypothetical protein
MIRSPGISVQQRPCLENLCIHRFDPTRPDPLPAVGTLAEGTRSDAGSPGDDAVVQAELRAGRGQGECRRGESVGPQ